MAYLISSKSHIFVFVFPLSPIYLHIVSQNIGTPGNPSLSLISYPQHFLEDGTVLSPGHSLIHRIMMTSGKRSAPLLACLSTKTVVVLAWWKTIASLGCICACYHRIMTYQLIVSREQCLLQRASCTYNIHSSDKGGFQTILKRFVVSFMYT